MKQVWVNQRLKIRIPQDVDAVLEEVAHSNRMTKQEVIRYIIEHEKTSWSFSNQAEQMRYLVSKFLDHLLSSPTSSKILPMRNTHEG